MPTENLDDTVSKAFAQAVASLTKAGARLRDKALPLIDKMVEVNKRGGVQPAEAFTVNRDLLDRRGADMDQNIRSRLERARTINAADYIWMVRERAGLIAEMDAWLADTDVLVMPTCPIVAPTQAEVASPDEFARKNAMALRNTSVWNFFDCCAISLPIPGASLPAGLMLVARNGRDRELFAAATAAERALA
jgi:aspartyl-tRNA(Asn)/glutamyl-tRNA(Gln) amidotransferase subunit A